MALPPFIVCKKCDSVFQKSFLVCFVFSILKFISSPFYMLIPLKHFPNESSLINQRGLFFVKNILFKTCKIIYGNKIKLF